MPARARRSAASHALPSDIPADYGIRRGLKRQREATRLVAVGKNPDGRIVRLAPRAAAAWKRMREHAARDGVMLLPLSGFRSVRRQRRIIREKLAAGRHIDNVLRFVAAPGYSEHHTGRALDLGSPEGGAFEERFARTAAWRWLLREASTHGFVLSYPRGNTHGFGYEPWHWCWRPGVARGRPRI